MELSGDPANARKEKKSLRSNPRILTVVRVRPPKTYLQNSSAAVDSTIRVLSDTSLVVNAPKTRGRLQAQPQQYHADCVLDFEASQGQVWETIAPAFANVLKFNGSSLTLMAFGATATGKTYTIIGPPAGSLKEVCKIHTLSREKRRAQRGVLPRLCEKIFQSLQNRQDRDALRISVASFEIYKETLRDLFATSGDQGPIRTQAKKPPLVVCHGEDIVNLRWITVTTCEALIALLSRGCQRRAVRETRLNSKSSRSHAIWRIRIERLEAVGAQRVGEIQLVDLAGAESHYVEDPLPKPGYVAEMAFINRSLSSLAHCVEYLAKHPESQRPFRDSKLTRVLTDKFKKRRDQLIVIFTASPLAAHYRASLLTLQLARTMVTSPLSCFVPQQQDQGPRADTDETALNATPSGKRARDDNCFEVLPARVKTRRLPAISARKTLLSQPSTCLEGQYETNPSSLLRDQGDQQIEVSNMSISQVGTLRGCNSALLEEPPCANRNARNQLHHHPFAVEDVSPLCSSEFLKSQWVTTYCHTPASPPPSPSLSSSTMREILFHSLSHPRAYTLEKNSLQPEEAATQPMQNLLRDMRGVVSAESAASEVPSISLSSSSLSMPISARLRTSSSALGALSAPSHKYVSYNGSVDGSHGSTSLKGTCTTLAPHASSLLRPGMCSLDSSLSSANPSPHQGFSGGAPCVGWPRASIVRHFYPETSVRHDDHSSVREALPTDPLKDNDGWALACMTREPHRHYTYDRTEKPRAPRQSHANCAPFHSTSASYLHFPTFQPTSNGSSPVSPILSSSRRPSATVCPIHFVKNALGTEPLTITTHHSMHPSLNHCSFQRQAGLLRPVWCVNKSTKVNQNGVISPSLGQPVSTFPKKETNHMYSFSSLLHSMAKVPYCAA